MDYMGEHFNILATDERNGILAPTDERNGILAGLEALSKALGEIETIKKTEGGKGSIIRYSYATLASMDPVRIILSKYGIFLSQPIRVVNNRSYLYTFIRYKGCVAPLEYSIQDLDALMEAESQLIGKDRKENPITGAKRFGAVVSYARKYGALSILGLACEEDLDAIPDTQRKPAEKTESQKMIDRYSALKQARPEDVRKAHAKAREKFGLTESSSAEDKMKAVVAVVTELGG